MPDKVLSYKTDDSSGFITTAGTIISMVNIIKSGIFENSKTKIHFDFDFFGILNSLFK